MSKRVLIDLKGASFYPETRTRVTSQRHKLIERLVNLINRWQQECQISQISQSIDTHGTNYGVSNEMVVLILSVKE